MKQALQIFSRLAIVLTLLTATQGCRQKSQTDKTTDSTEIHTQEEDPARYFLGIRTDTLAMQEGKIPRGGSLSFLLGQLGVGPSTIDQCAKKARPVFNVRHLQAGKPYYSLSSKDSTNSLKYFIYQENVTDFVVFDFSDSLQIYRKQKEISVETRLAEGEIDHSLWMSMKERGYNINLALDLSDITPGKSTSSAYRPATATR